MFIVALATREGANGGAGVRAGQPGERIRVKAEINAAQMGHLMGVSEQAKSCYVCHALDPGRPRGLCRLSIEAFHALDGGRDRIWSGLLALESGRYDSGSQALGEHKLVSRLAT